MITRLLLIFLSFSAQAETCAQAYARASQKYVLKAERERSFARGTQVTTAGTSVGVYIGCTALTGGWGFLGCLLPAGAVVYLGSGGPRTAYLEPELQLHLVNLVYEESKQETTEGSQVVHALAEASGWPESEVLAEVARHMRAGDLCQAGEPSVGLEELATELKKH